MRLLPRSPRGIWLLAGCLWLAVSAIVWWALPARPRMTIEFPGDNRLLGVGPDGQMVVWERAPVKAGESSLTVVIRVWDTTVASVRTVFEASDRSTRHELSPDGRLLAVADPFGGIRNVRLMDLPTGHEVELVNRVGPLAFYGLLVFSPDGRWLAVGEKTRENVRGVRLWDVSARRTTAFLPGAIDELVFSSDGTRLAAIVSTPAVTDEDAADFVVWEITTGRELLRMRRPMNDQIVALTPDGTGLIVETMLRKYICWNVADGSERWSNPGLCPLRGGQRLSMWRRDETLTTNEVVNLDFDTGVEIGHVPLGRQVQLLDAEFGGRNLLTANPSAGVLDAIRTWLAGQGMAWLEPMSSGHLELLDATTGRRVCSLPLGALVIAADGRSLAIRDETGALSLWDIPPRKSMTWYLGICAVLALPLAWLARRRVRKTQTTLA